MNNHEEHKHLAEELENLRKRREHIKSVLEQAKGRAAELENRIEEQRVLLLDLGVTPDTAPHVLEALRNEIIYNKNIAERLIEEVEGVVYERKE